MPIKSWGDLLNDAGGSGDSYDPIPAGDYDFVISQAEAAQSQAGKTMYKVRCKVEAGPHKDRLVFDQFVISPENPTALSIFFRQMNILGLNREFFGSNPSDHHVAEKLNGRRFRGQVQIKTWQGQERNEIKQYFTATSGAFGNGSPTPGTPQGMPSAPAPAPAAPTPAAAPPAPPAAPAAAPAPAPAPPAAPAAPAPAPAPEYAAPAAPAAPEQPAPAPTPAPEPVQQAEVPPVATPAEPPAAPAPVAEAPAATPNVPQPPPF